MLTNIIACRAFCDVCHTTGGLTKLANILVERFFILLSHFKY